MGHAGHWCQGQPQGPLGLLPTLRRERVNPALAPSPCTPGSPIGQHHRPQGTAAVSPPPREQRAGDPKALPLEDVGAPLACWLRLWFSLLLGGRKWGGATGSLGQALHGPVPGLGSRPRSPAAISGPLLRLWAPPGTGSARLQGLHWLRDRDHWPGQGPLPSCVNYGSNAPLRGGDG